MTSSHSEWGSTMYGWRAGTPVVYRELWQGKVWTARPVRVVQDAPDLIALYLGLGTQWKLPAGGRERYLAYQLGGEWELAGSTWLWGDSLILIPPGEAHSVNVMWNNKGRAFVGWYINLQEPVRRTASGFDSMDQILDIVVEPDLSGWWWKDEEEFQQAQEVGLYSPQQARRIRAEGERVLERVQTQSSPFCDGWEQWTAPADWPLPLLPPGWDVP